MPTPTPDKKPKYRIEWNAKIGKWQIKLPNYNVACAEFYDNTTASREEIEKLLSGEGIADPSEALRVAREALTRVAKLNESAGEIGAGMLAIIVGEARAALALLTQSQPEGRQG